MHDPDSNGPDREDEEREVSETSAGDEGAGLPGEPQTAQLDLGDEDPSLPWLEGDDAYDEEEAGYNTGQMIALVLVGLVVIGLVVGGIWWASGESSDEELVAEGGVIEAPDGPYKKKPEDPGGMTFEGTGDTSFAVSEGQTRPAKLGNEPPSPGPGFTALGKGAPAATPPAPGQGAQAALDRKSVGVQVGAFSTKSSAEAGWAKLQQQHEALSGLRYRIVEGQADIGTVYRLQALADDAASARSLCAGLKAAGLNCQVKN